MFLPYIAGLTCAKTIKFANILLGSQWRDSKKETVN